MRAIITKIDIALLLSNTALRALQPLFTLTILFTVYSWVAYQYGSAMSREWNQVSLSLQPNTFCCLNIVISYFHLVMPNRCYNKVFNTDNKYESAL